MFAKPYKPKSTNTLKNSEKKHLIQRIHDEFPAISDDKTRELLSVKSNTICHKLTTHSGIMVNVYVVENVPIFIEMERGLIPTICALWKVPELLPILTVQSLVIPKLQSGVPLYAPGVIIPPQGIGLPFWDRGATVALRTPDNSAVAAVGLAVMSSSQLLLSTSGVCWEPLQVIGDQLCKDDKFNKIERPKLGAAISTESKTLIETVSLNPSHNKIDTEWPSLVKETKTAHVKVENEPKIIPDTDRLIANEDLDTNLAELSINNEEPSKLDPDLPEDMDGLLRYCLLTFLKYQAKKVELPLKTNLLYRNHLLPLCPEGRTLDVKKSTYKKMSKFLDAMQKEGLLEVRELEKGVDAVMCVNLLHPLIVSHRASRPVVVAPQSQTQEDRYIPPTISEVYALTAALLPVFSGVKKGTVLSPPEVRSAVTEYVKNRNLTSSQKGAVVLDETLAAICGKKLQDTIKWDELMSCVHNKLTSCTEFRHANGEVKLYKNKLEPIKMQVATRSGNKKVTLVSNLQLYGLSLNALCNASQAGAAAAASVTRTPGSVADQLLIQGDQTYFIAKLLVEEYKIPKKYVEGAEKALKKKNNR